MRVLITGASGFVGCHIAAGLRETGHSVRALVRSQDKLDRAMAPLGSRVDDVVVGDVTDSGTVQRAVTDCDATIHAANVYSLDPRRAAEMTSTNVDGTRNVLDAAIEAGCDPIVHISTAQTFWPSPKPVDGDPPLAPLQGMPYSDSKKKAEEIARRRQAQGAPVTTTYPGAILGPDDPGPGEQLGILRAVLVPTAPMRIDGGFPLCDIDWVTRLHLRLMQPGDGPRRITCSGTYLRWQELFSLARRVTGRSLPNPLPSPRWLTTGMCSTMDALQRVVPIRLPFAREVAWILYSACPSSDRQASNLAGSPPPIEETFTRAVRWAVDAGHLTSRQAGMLASG